MAGCPPKIPMDTRMKAQTMYLAGAATPDIALQLGLNPATVRTWCDREDWTSKRRAMVAKVVDRVVDQSGSKLAEAITRHQTQTTDVVNVLLDRIKHFNPAKASDFDHLTSAADKIVTVERRNLGLADVNAPQPNLFGVNVNVGDGEARVVSVKTKSLPMK